MRLAEQLDAHRKARRAAHAERRIAAFGEDRSHREIVGALASRIAAEANHSVTLDWRSAYGGHPRVAREVSRYLKDLARQSTWPDLVLIATDANCKGLVERSRQIPVDQSPVPAVLAIPDPHMERWLLIDSSAFKAVLGKGCQTPDQKCARDRYKQLLAEAVRDAGIEPLLGGIEYAADIVSNMDLERAARADALLDRFRSDLRQALKG
jgi:hypothetical protein